MQISKNQFKENLINTIEEEGLVFDKSNIRFIITPIKETNVKYSSLDDYIRLGMLADANLNDRYFSLDEVTDFLVFPSHKFPIWIKVLFKEESNGYFTFELKTSMRFRTPTQLKYIESGHPPFVFEKED